jgi:streptomycin 6-kinase
MSLAVPEQLAASCRRTPERRAWLERLSDAVREVRERWSLSLEVPFGSDEVSCSWVAPATRVDGTRAVLKLGMPHFEGEQEIAGLRFWDGDGTVRLLEADDDLNAMLLERCEPGTFLRSLPEPEQDVLVAKLLRRLWRLPAQPHAFRPLSTMIAYWSNETIANSAGWLDAGLVREGLRLFEELALESDSDVLLATDLHAGNVLRAAREPWLVIDPKPFVGDPAYDATQHLLNCRARVLQDDRGTIRRFADLLEVDSERVRLWLFARSAAEPRETWDEASFALARRLAKNWTRR